MATRSPDSEFTAYFTLCTRKYALVHKLMMHCWKISARDFTRDSYRDEARQKQHLAKSCVFHCANTNTYLPKVPSPRVRPISYLPTFLTIVLLCRWHNPEELPNRFDQEFQVKREYAAEAEKVQSACNKLNKIVIYLTKAALTNSGLVHPLRKLKI